VSSGKMDRRKRVVLLTTSLGFGGASTVVVELAERLKGRQWEVEVVSLTDPSDASKTDRLERAGTPWHSLEMVGHRHVFRALWKLRRILRRQPPTVLHTHMVHANILGRLARPGCQIPVLISTAHSVNEGSQWRYWAYRLTDPLADLTTQVSEEGRAESLRRGAVPKGKLLTIPNGVDTSKYRRPVERAGGADAATGVPRQADPFTWLAIGRFVVAKDYPNLLRAAAILTAEGIPFRLWIAGQGDLEPEMRLLSRQLEVEEAVTFLGTRKDMVELMSKVDGFVMSSAWEGLPLALLEAAAVGLPVVATRVGGIPEVVQDGLTGLLVPAGDPSCLAKAMKRVMLMNPHEREAMGKAGRHLVEQKYDWERVLEMWEAVYTRLSAG
jgi:glycosyltransferase involved in cell wall biosynthesis